MRPGMCPRRGTNTILRHPASRRAVAAAAWPGTPGGFRPARRSGSLCPIVGGAVRRRRCRSGLSGLARFPAGPISPFLLPCNVNQNWLIMASPQPQEISSLISATEIHHRHNNLYVSHKNVFLNKTKTIK